MGPQTVSEAVAASPRARSALGLFLALAGALAALRVAGLIASPLDLHFDEAQYWYWSRSLEFGYYSKPPLIAWTIWATTALFGNAEWAVRLAAPIAHALGALALFLLGRRLYGATAGLWAGALWLTLPAVWLSSAIMSTDALVLPIWSFAVYALWRMTESRGAGWAIALGLAIGIGSLAKYAMLYFPLCAALAALWSKPVRTALSPARIAIILAAALVVLGPHLAWNALNEFKTVQHTAENVNVGAGFALHPQELLEFLGSQAGVVGPVLFVALFLMLARALRGSNETDRFLIAFILPPLIIILMQALISRAHANWAAAAYPAALVWLAGRLVASRAGRITLTAAMAMHAALGAMVFAVGVRPQIADAVGLSDAIKRARGWAETVDEIEAQARAAGADVIVVDHRALFFETAYYWRDRAGPRLRMWRIGETAQNHAEDVAPMREGDGRRALIAHMEMRYLPLMREDFQRLTPLGAFVQPLGGGEERRLAFSLGEGFAPAPRDAAFAQRRAAIENAR